MQRDQLLAGRYRLGERLGKGGMSVVHRAHDEVLERDVAVKVLVAADQSARRRIQDEAKAAARLSHPNVTGVYDYGESLLHGRWVPFVVMELLSGRTLAQRLAAGPLPPREAVRVCAEVAAGLAAAHAQGLVHRDVKPENVVLAPTGAKVVDFGIAAVAGAPEIDFEGRLLGTPAYLAPERLAAGGVLPASDVYALGLLVHQVLTGRLPWHGETQTGMLRAHAYAEPGPLPAVDGVPAEIGRLYRRCVAKAPGDRPSAAEVARVLTGALARMPAAEPASGPADGPVRPPGAAGVDGRPARGGWGSRRGSRVVAALGAAVVGVVAVAGTLGDASGRRSGAADEPRTGIGTGPVGSTSVALPVTADAPKRPAAPGAGPPVGSATAGRSSPGPVAPSAAAPTGGGPTAPAPTGGAEPTPARPSEVDVVARGGVVTVRCDGKLAVVVDVAPAAGHHAEAYAPGPAREVRVELVSAESRSLVTVRCANGRPVPRVKEKGR
ncbi:serine/threonine protein kinase [Micromonospora citrea]|uniref:non-specific serine/threonine protein kinase n=1 Tax=Micromonospora citrea TaxID=47855 RepID=A0A1C6V939_9ACTN|nr:serine/threonine-protein kinase [Micromonospora citrea]SCL62796.1 serine/threonine protein kinase [Micromonospora citrea]